MIMKNLQEEEKLELIKLGFKKWGKIIAIFLFIFFLILIGWQFWLSHINAFSERSSLLYDKMIDSATNHQDEPLKHQADFLVKNYSSTPYASIAQFLLARQAIEKNKLNVAMDHLQWVRLNSHQPMFIDLAKFYSARILLAQNKPDEALTELKGMKQFYPIPVAFLKSQILLALGKHDEAKQVLNQTLQSLPEETSSKTILEMQLHDL